MMRHYHAVLLLGMAILAACNPPDPDTYPITGAECHEGDPVQGLDLPPCPPV